jgi:hypothetical protein
MESSSAPWARLYFIRTVQERDPYDVARMGFRQGSFEGLRNGSIRSLVREDEYPPGKLGLEGFLPVVALKDVGIPAE